MVANITTDFVITMVKYVSSAYRAISVHLLLWLHECCSSVMLSDISHLI